MEFPRVEQASQPFLRGPDICVTCGPSAAVHPYRSISGWQLVRCASCGLVSLSGAAGAGDGVSATNEPFFSSEDFNRWFLAHEEAFRQRYRRDLDEIAGLAPVGRLLDVGCGPGLFLDEARRRGWNVHGVEASSAPVAIARERFALPVAQGLLEQAGFPEASFDVVTFFDVLEHLPDPRSVLVQAVRALRPGGLLVAQSPNLQSLMARLTARHWHWYFMPQHLHHFTPSSLEFLLRAAGLAPVRTTTWDIPEEFAANLRDRFAVLRGRSRGKALLRRAVRIGISWGSKLWAPRGLGGLIRIFARKGPETAA